MLLNSTNIADLTPHHMTQRQYMNGVINNIDILPISIIFTSNSPITKNILRYTLKYLINSRMF